MKEDVKNYKRRYYLINKQRIREKQKIYEVQHPEVKLRSSRKYSETHREIINLKARLKYPERKEYQSNYRRIHHQKLKKYQEVYRKKYKLLNPDYFKNHYRKNREKRKKESLDWMKKNRDKRRRIVKQHDALHRGARGSHTEQEWINLCLLLGNHCLGCWKKPKLEEDHIIPLSKNGTNFIDNIQPLCRLCNARKGNKYDVPNLITIIKR